MNTQKHLRFFLGLLYTALALGAFILLLPGLLPFLLGLGLAGVLEPAVRILCIKLRFHRGLTSAVILLFFTALIVTGGILLLRRLWFELTALSAKLPVWMELVQNLNQQLDDLIYRWTVAVSPEFRSALQAALAKTAEQLTSILSTFTASLLELVADGLFALPRAVLFLFTALLSGYFILACKPDLTAFFQRKIPDRWLPHLNKIVPQLKTAVGGWLKAQGILMAINFLLLTAGFLFMKIDAALLLAAGIALLDALPIFGTGTVLLPWAFFCILNGELRRGFSLSALYAVLWLIRNILEPKLISNRAGLHPLAALFAMYLGFSLFGVAGMLLAPLVAVLAAQLYQSGILNFRKR